MGRYSPRLRRIGLVYLALLVGAVFTIVLSQYFHLGVIATAVLTLAPSVSAPYLSWENYRATRSETAQGLALADVADQLAIAVGRQWEAEQQLRRLNNPPLPVSWEAVDSDLVEEWSSVVETASDWPDFDPARWAGSKPTGLAGADRNKLAQVLDQVPTRRLVVLGQPGAGKTMLLVRLVLDLLTRRAPGDSVPVLMSLASWNPAEQDLHTWLVGRLTIDYPALVEPAPSATGRISRAQALLAKRLLLPILDGLDEIPESVRGQALDEINNALRPGDGLIVSSRIQDYRQAVHPPVGGPVKLRGSAGVVVCDLDPTDVDKYLRHDAGSAADRWDPVLATSGKRCSSGGVDGEPLLSPVGKALRTPLMVSLAYTIYNPRPGEHFGSLPNPAELCDASRFPTQASVEEHLFDAFIPAAYRGHPDRHGRWTPGQAHQYLAFLARRLECHLNGVPDLAWWELSRLGIKPAKSLRWSLAAFKARLVFGLATGMATGLVYGLVFGPTVGRAIGLATGLAATLVFGLAAGLETAQTDLTRATDPGAVLARDRSAFLTFGLLLGPLVGLIVGLVVGLTISPAVGLATRPVVGPAVGLMAALMFGLVSKQVVIGLMFGSVVGTVDWLVSLLTDHLMGRLAGGLVAQLVSGLLMGLVVGLLLGILKAAWGAFVITRCWLALRGRLPWRLIGFLADAHQRGVLRQVGAFYQFRHVQLQRHLASPTR